MVSTAAEIFSSEMETPLIIGPSANEWILVPPNKVSSSPHLPCNESIDGCVVLEKFHEYGEADVDVGSNKS